MIPEDEFECALQDYLKAVTLYKLAIKHYVEDVGEAGAQQTLQAAGDRICYQDSVIATPVVMRVSEWKQSVKRAMPIVDADCLEAKT